MRIKFVAAVVLAVFLAPQFASAQQAPPQPAGAVDGEQAEAAKTPTQLDEETANIFMAEKKYVEADRIYQRLARENPHNAAYANFSGIAHMQTLDLNGARMMFERAIKADKKFSEAYNNLGAVWFSLKDYKKAIREYQRALEVRPNTSAYYANMGYAYFNRNKIPDAILMFQKALALDPEVFERTGRGATALADRTVTDHGLFDFMMAKSFAQTGDATHCAFYLRKAAEDHYKDIAKVRSDPAFAKLLTTPEVQAVLDQVAPLPIPPADANAKPPGT
jgi:tetratricopeptide (TPR) repeat protein